MGKLDRRHSPKMKRRKAQVKKKAREAAKKVKPIEAAATGKKTRSSKAAPAAS
jgi:hypothetical protein